MATGTIKKSGLPTALSRPLSADQNSQWTFTATANGILYLGIRSNSRSYVSIDWNGEHLIAVALSGTQENITPAVPCKAGDVVTVTGLNANTYLLSGLTAFVTNS